MEVREQRADEVVDDVVLAAFGRPEVVDLAHDLAQGAHLASLVAGSGGQVVGHVQLSRSWVDAPARLVEVPVLSPLSVLPAWQRRGIGSTLVEAAARWAADAGWPVLFLEGDPAYYGRLGFEPAGPLGFTPPSVRIPAPAFQVRRLPAYDPGLRGALVYADAFWRHDAVGLRDHDGHGAR